jgi:hypothetical protein
MSAHRPAAERFWEKVIITDGCWYWSGSKTPAGYGTFKEVSGSNWTYAHRYAYRACVGGIPRGLPLDHLCRTRCCVRWDHLEPVTHQTNVLRGIGPAARNAAKTHCAQGHEFNEANTRSVRTRPGHRYCRLCNIASAAAQRARRKESPIATPA